MHEQWQYVILRGGWERVMQRIELKDDADVEYGALSEETLNRMGAEGWEVCGYSESPDRTCTVILKRRVVSQGG